MRTTTGITYANTANMTASTLVECVHCGEFADPDPIMSGGCHGWTCPDCDESFAMIHRDTFTTNAENLGR